MHMPVMDRRHFVVGMAAVGCLSTKANAAIQCTPFDASGLQGCAVGLPFPHIAAATTGTRQEMQNWCWAACIAGIFAWYGHPVSQHVFVEKVFGEIVDRPATGAQIFHAVNGTWYDAYGRPFVAQASVLLDAQYAFRNPAAPHAMAADLANNHPLIVGTQGHATVVTAMSYIRSTNGSGQITDVVVRDPWPMSPSRRSLSAAEVNNAILLTQVRVQSL